MLDFDECVGWSCLWRRVVGNEGEGLRGEVGASHRDENEHHVGTDRPGGAQDYTERRIENTSVLMGRVCGNPPEGVLQKLRCLGKRPER